MSAIRVKAICVVTNGGQTLAEECRDTVTGNAFYCPLGGGVDFGETSRDAVEREFRGEIGGCLFDLRFETVIENRFFQNGKDHHEIVFLYSGRLQDDALLTATTIPFLPPEQHKRAVWLNIADVLGGAVTLKPRYDFSPILLRGRSDGTVTPEPEALQ